MRLFRPLLCAALLSLAACGGSGDEDDLSLHAPIAAGGVIYLKHQPSGAPGTTYRLAYHSTDALNARKLVPVTANVIVPYGDAPPGGWPLMVWGHASTGVGLTCAPSVMGIGGPQAAFYGAWLRAGFAVVATDFPGLGEAGPPLFLNARSEAMAMLDSARAARKALSSLGERIILQGHDEGAQGALAAAALAKGYAPELQIAGTIAIAPPDPADNPEFLSGSGNRHRFSPSVAHALILGASLGKAEPTFRPDEAFTSRAMPAYAVAGKECRSDVFVAAERRGLTPSNAFKPGIEKALAPAIDWTRYPTFKLDQPVMVAIGTRDSQVSVSVQEALTRKLCSAGTAVTLHHYHGAEHTPVRARAQTDALDFARSVLEGHKPAKTCG